MNQFHTIWYLLGFLLFFSSCSKEIEDTTGHINGTVRDARTNEVIRGAAVSLSETGASISTGVDGTFVFKDLAPKTYTLKATKSDYQSETKTVQVVAGRESRVDIMLQPSVASLSLSQLSLDFGSSTTSLSFDIKNTGHAPLNWSINEDISWLSCSPTSGTTQSGEKSSVVVNVKREGLERGNYSQTIAVASNGGSEVIRVDMQIMGTMVSVDPESLDFGTVTTSLQLTLTNNGSGNVTYAATPSNDWININKTTGTFSKQENITVSVNRSSKSAGSYSGAVVLKIGQEEVRVPVIMSIPEKECPTVVLYEAQDVTYNSAYVRAGIVSIGSAKVIKHGFCWGTDPQPTQENSSVCNLGDTSEPKDFTYSLKSLESNTVYYVSAYAENAEGISYSNVIKFKTTGTPEKPSVETGSFTNVTDNSASVGGNILSLGNVESISQYGHVWSLKPEPTTKDNKTELGKTSQTGSFISTLTSLSPNTTYYVRAYAVNQIGTAYGAEESFTTRYGDVVLSTEFAKNVTFKSAIIPCKVISLGGHSLNEVGICWGNYPNPDISSTVSIAKSVSNNYEITLSDLPEDTKFYVRAYAKTEEGQTFYGNEIMFVTSAKNVSLDIDDYPGDHNWDSQGLGVINKDGYDKDDNWSGE